MILSKATAWIFLFHISVRISLGPLGFLVICFFAWATQPRFCIPFLEQYFADRDIFCAGRVSEEDLQRVAAATGGTVQTSVNNVIDEVSS